MITKGNWNGLPADVRNKIQAAFSLGMGDEPRHTISTGQILSTGHSDRLLGSVFTIEKIEAFLGKKFKSVYEAFDALVEEIKNPAKPVEKPTEKPKVVEQATKLHVEIKPSEPAPVKVRAKKTKTPSVG